MRFRVTQKLHGIQCKTKAQLLLTIFGTTTLIIAVIHGDAYSSFLIV